MREKTRKIKKLLSILIISLDRYRGHFLRSLRDFLIVILIMSLSLSPNIALAGEIDLNSDQSPQTAYEQLIEVTGLYKPSHKTIGTVVKAAGISSLVYSSLLFYQYFSGQDDVYFSALQSGVNWCIYGTILTKWGVTVLYKNGIAYKIDNISPELRNTEAENMLSKMVKTSKYSRYIIGTLSGYLLLDNLDNMHQISAYFLGAITVYSFIIKSPSEKAYKSYIEGKEANEVNLIPIITPKYSGIMVVKRF